jgi:hypothetical protein
LLTNVCPLKRELIFGREKQKLKTRRDRCRTAIIREQLKQESLIDGIERRKLRWCGHLVRMAEERKPRQILEARIEGKRGRGRPRKVWMDDIKEVVGRRGKTIQEARSMAMTRKDFRRWTEDPTLKGKRERQRRMRFTFCLHSTSPPHLNPS